jgi:C-terminal processing protease CtpA/Prc
LTLEIPAAADVPTGGAHGGNCPQDRLGNLLGVTLARTHGLVIGTVIPGGPADKAGIKPGDMLGEPSDCPQTSLPRFEASKEPREMKVNVQRPRSASASASVEAKAEETAPGEQEASSE